MIKLNEISLKFDNKTIIDNFSYTFNDNNIYCIMGQSGCGKTSLLKIISSLLHPTKGEVFYNNKKVYKPISEIFMMHQHYTNFPWKTCIENILFPISIKRKITEEDYQNAKQFLKNVGLEEYENKFPYELSGGMNQRLSLARVLMAKPKVLLMDEPMSALDIETRTKMQDLVLNMHNKTKNIIIMVTHSENEARKMGDKILKF